MTDRIPAILLVGPTGAGKTPLGEYLQLHGLGQRRCAHFDFGSQLRRIAADGAHRTELSEADLHVIRRSLDTGALLEDRHFPIAARILSAFADKQLSPATLIILNGLPRHEGQARDMESIISMQAVVSLQCSAQVAYDRINLNSGGDRTGRIDDSVEAIARKLELFDRRTLPLLNYYRRQSVPVYSIIIGADTSPQEICHQLAAMQPK